MTSPQFDVLGIGVLAVDEIIHVLCYPPADEKAPVLKEERVFGGLMGTALAAIAQLGGHCAYLGTLGQDELSRSVLAGLSELGVDVDRVSVASAAGPVHSIIIADDSAHTRNIFFNESRVAPPALTAITPDVLRRCRVLLVDHVHLQAAVAACRLARELGIPSVADVESSGAAQADELISAVDHLIVSRSFAAALTGASEPAEMVRSLCRKHPRACTAVTCGRSGVYFAGDDGAVQHRPAYVVTPMDTTGCGDVFHGAYALALARGQGVAQCIDFAAAAAAVFASRPPGWHNLPHASDVAALLGRIEKE